MPLEGTGIFGRKSNPPQDSLLAGTRLSDPIGGLLLEQRYEKALLKLYLDPNDPKARVLRSILNLPTGNTKQTKDRRTLFFKILRENNNKDRTNSDGATIEINRHTIAALVKEGFIKNPLKNSTDTIRDLLYDGLRNLSFIKVIIPDSIEISRTKLRKVQPGGQRTITKREALAYLKAFIILAPTTAAGVFNQFEKNLGAFLSNNPNKEIILRRFRWQVRKALKRIDAFAAQAPKANETTAKRLAGQIRKEQNRVVKYYKWLILKEVQTDLKEYRNFGAEITKKDGVARAIFNRPEIQRLYRRGKILLYRALRAARKGNIPKASVAFIKGTRIFDKIKIYIKYAALVNDAKKTLRRKNLLLQYAAHLTANNGKTSISGIFGNLQNNLNALMKWGPRILKYSDFSVPVTRYNKIAPKIKLLLQKLDLLRLVLRNQGKFAKIKLPDGFRALAVGVHSLRRRSDFLAKKILTATEITPKLQTAVLTNTRAVESLMEGLKSMAPNSKDSELGIMTPIKKFIHSLGLPVRYIIEKPLKKRYSHSNLYIYNFKLQDYHARRRLLQLIKWDNSNGRKLGLEKLARAFRNQRNRFLLRAQGKGAFFYHRFTSTALRLSHLLVIADYLRAAAGMRRMGIKINRSRDVKIILEVNRKVANGKEVTKAEHSKAAQAQINLVRIAKTYRWYEETGSSRTINRLIRRAIKKLPSKTYQLAGAILRRTFSGGLHNMPAIRRSARRLFALAARGLGNSQEAINLKKDIIRRIGLLLQIGLMRVSVRAANEAQADAGFSPLRKYSPEIKWFNKRARMNYIYLNALARYVMNGKSFSFKYGNTIGAVPAFLGGLSDARFKTVLKSYFKPVNNFIKRAHGTANWINKVVNVAEQVLFLALSMLGAEIIAIPSTLFRGLAMSRAAAAGSRVWRAVAALSRASVHVSRGFGFTLVHRQLESSIKGIEHKESFLKSFVKNTLMFAAHAGVLKKLKLHSETLSATGRVSVRQLSLSRQLLKLGIVDPGFFTGWGVFMQIMDSDMPLNKIFSWGNIKTQLVDSLILTFAMAATSGVSRRGAKALERVATGRIKSRIASLRIQRLAKIALRYEQRIETLQRRLKEIGNDPTKIGEKVRILQKIAKLGNKWEKSVHLLRKARVIPKKTYKAVRLENRKYQKQAQKAGIIEARLREAGINVGPSSRFLARMAKWMGISADIVQVKYNDVFKKELSVDYVYSRGIELTTDVKNQVVDFCRSEGYERGDILVITKTLTGHVKVRIVNFKNKGWQNRKVGKGYFILDNYGKKQHFKPLSLEDAVKRMIGFGSFWKFADQRGQIGDSPIPESVTVGKFKPGQAVMPKQVNVTYEGARFINQGTDNSSASVKRAKVGFSGRRAEEATVNIYGENNKGSMIDGVSVSVGNVTPKTYLIRIERGRLVVYESFNPETGKGRLATKVPFKVIIKGDQIVIRSLKGQEVAPPADLVIKTRGRVGGKVDSKGDIRPEVPRRSVLPPEEDTQNRPQVSSGSSPEAETGAFTPEALRGKKSGKGSSDTGAFTPEALEGKKSGKATPPPIPKDAPKRAPKEPVVSSVRYSRIGFAIVNLNRRSVEVELNHREFRGSGERNITVKVLKKVPAEMYRVVIKDGKIEVFKIGVGSKLKKVNNYPFKVEVNGNKVKISPQKIAQRSEKTAVEPHPPTVVEPNPLGARVGRRARGRVGGKVGSDGQVRPQPGLQPHKTDFKVFVRNKEYRIPQHGRTVTINGIKFSKGVMMQFELPEGATARRIHNGEVQELKSRNITAQNGTYIVTLRSGGKIILRVVEPHVLNIGGRYHYNLTSLENLNSTMLKQRGIELPYLDMPAHGTNSSFEALIAIALSKKVVPFLGGKANYWSLVGKDGNYSAHPHGPFYVIFRKSNGIYAKDGSIPSQHHRFYLVPNSYAKASFIKAINEALSKGLISSADAKAIKSKVITFKEFLTLPDVKRKVVSLPKKT